MKKQFIYEIKTYKGSSYNDNNLITLTDNITIIVANIIGLIGRQEKNR